ncbi:ammonium transporter [uncultured Desulfovibrio sp.]|uniref:ammonium transporter n=1 Tax=uncultured Desulfovibrio sp. TaxID=167968 RepID=UPI00262F7608|nr:ammonium transporter [uncultured Desulfovibrio sp.]
MTPADTTFIIICAGLVMLMTPALALFYGGLVRSRNVLSTHMHSYASLGLITVLWALAGYTLAFGNDVGGLIGDLSYLFLNGVEGVAAPMAPQLPHTVFMAFQCMFAVLTVALISGAYAERIRFSGMLLFSALWLFFAYAPMAHWVWGGGWMAKMGAVDFAGGAVVHMASAAAALACAQALGPRLSTGPQSFTPHNLPMTLLGGGMLWFGWFGFNAGSALAAGPLAGHALLTTHLATACGILGWMLVEWKRTGKPTSLGAISGALAGLVAITPGAGFVGLLPAMIIGFVGGIVCYGGVLLKSRFGYDDALDVVGIHGVGGTWGALATGLFACAAINNVDGLFYGNPRQLWVQFVSVVGTWVFVYVVSRILLFIVDRTVGLRVTPDAEYTGLDLTEHNERGYSL